MIDQSILQFLSKFPNLSLQTKAKIGKNYISSNFKFGIDLFLKDYENLFCDFINTIITDKPWTRYKNRENIYLYKLFQNARNSKKYKGVKSYLKFMVLTFSQNQLCHGFTKKLANIFQKYAVFAISLII